MKLKACVIGMCLLIMSITPACALEIDQSRGIGGVDAASTATSTSLSSLEGQATTLFNTASVSQDEQVIANNMNPSSTVTNSTSNMVVSYMKRHWKLIVGTLIIIITMAINLYYMYQQAQLSAEYDRRNKEITALDEESKKLKTEYKELEKKANLESEDEADLDQNLDQTKPVEFKLTISKDRSARDAYSKARNAYEVWRKEVYTDKLTKFNVWFEEMEKIDNSYASIRRASHMGMLCGAGLGIYSIFFD